jgi:hypothetical protein
MSDIQNCLPQFARRHYIRVRNQKSEEARSAYRAKLTGLRAQANARGGLRSGFQELAEWKLTEELVGLLAYGQFEAAVETLKLYDIPIDEVLCTCIENGIREFMIAQYRNLLRSSASGAGGIRIPLSVRNELAGGAPNTSVLNSIGIDLEKARVESQRRERGRIPSSPTSTERQILAILSKAFPDRLQLQDLGRAASLERDRSSLLRAINGLLTRGFLDCVPLRDSDGLVDAANITISTSGMKFLEESGDDDRGKKTPISLPGPSPSSGQQKLRTAVVLNVLIASPSDVSEEREIVTDAIHAWNAAHYAISGIMLHPVRWETHAFPASGERPQAIVNRQIVDEGDLLIGIFGYRLGTPTGETQSGTIEEIERFRRAGKYVALYFSTANVPRNADRGQLEALEKYQRDRQEDTLYFTFSNPEELREHLTQQLSKIIQEVHARLRNEREFEGLEDELRTIESNSGQRLSQIADQNHIPLADVLSELEDNLACAAKPSVGDAYRRPSSQVWKENRNKIVLPDHIRSVATDVYRQIDSWADVVDSGLNPNMGSTELHVTIGSLKARLPNLIAEFRKLLPCA